MTENVYQPPNSDLQNDQKDEVDIQEVREPLELGGWLILLAFGMIITPIRITYFLIVTYPPMFDDGTWHALTDLASAAYSPFWAPIILGEVIVNSLIVFASLYLAFLFFTKKSIFPKWYLSVAVISLIVILADAYAITFVLPDEPIFDSDTTKEVMRALISCIVWSPYLFLSKRARETFVL